MEYDRETGGDKLVPLGQAVSNVWIATSLEFPFIEILVWILQNANMTSEILRQLDDANVCQIRQWLDSVQP